MMHVLVILVALLGSSGSRADPAKLTFPSFPYPSAPLIPIAPLGTTFEINEAPPVPPLARSSHKPQHGESYGPSGPGSSSSYVPPSSSSGGYHQGAAPGTFAPGTSGCATCKGVSQGASHGSTSQGITSQGISSQGISSHSGTPQSPNDPCNPMPCGPNTNCIVDARDPYIAKCLCKTGFTPDGHTITGCLKLECTSDSECSARERCDKNKCVDVCITAGCGRDYQCVVEHHRARCACYPGYVEQGGRCKRKQEKQSAPRDPCASQPCGANTDCRSDGLKAVCSCMYRHEGNPLTGCVRSECHVHEDCPNPIHACKDRKCVNPCNIPGICGLDARCSNDRRTPICSCPKGRTGDPFTDCTKVLKICDVGTCGHDAVCTEQNGRAVCACKTNYIGDPLVKCRPECYTSSDCADKNDQCRDHKCSNPCHKGSCGAGAICKAVRGKAECSCPQFFKGNPFRSCYAECTDHSECSNWKACYKLQCIDPCTQTAAPVCGEDALCRVENHKAICSCPSTHTGHPYDKCRKFTPADLCHPNPCGKHAECNPGHDKQGNDRPVCSCPRGYTGDSLVGCVPGQCTESHECALHESCYNYNCQNACSSPTGSVCGTNADCRGKNHIPVCSCPPGYEGDALRNCYRRRQSSPHISVARSNVMNNMMNMKNWKK